MGIKQDCFFAITDSSKDISHGINFDFIISKGNHLLLDESSFAAQAVFGQPSCGFAIAAQNSDVRILKIEPSQ